jgi:hypothetical protein
MVKWFDTWVCEQCHANSETDEILAGACAIIFCTLGFGVVAAYALWKKLF